MIKGPRLTPPQWKILASAFSNISQGVVLFSLASLFVPEAVGLSREFSRITAVVFLLSGFFVLGFSAIIGRKS